MKEGQKLEIDYLDFASGIYPPTAWMMQRKLDPERVDYEEYSPGCWKRRIRKVKCTVRRGWAYPDEGEFPEYPVWVGADDSPAMTPPEHTAEIPNLVPAGCVTFAIGITLVLAVFAGIMALRALF